jgi:hypothetical protein
MAKQIKTADEVIDRLGGNSAVASLFAPQDRVTPNAVGNWRVRGLPPETFVALSKALNAKGFYAPPSLWRQRGLAHAVGA